ncbi:MAG: GAF domain-containing protein [Proteobacteria bacterium]|nr:GAF domain-containing protein [Pseudomonadota bacterium]
MDQHEPLSLVDARLQLRGLMQGEPDLVANSANFSALLAQQLADINWLGFYFLQGQELVLGPFQGKPACVRIPLGSGVCGAAVVQDKTQLVPDVHAFPGHIACDIASRSELVVPLHDGTGVIGVLDIDSPLTDRFSADDVQYIELLAREFCSLQFAQVQAGRS